MTPSPFRAILPLSSSTLHMIEKINLETSGFVFDMDGMLVKTQNEFHATAECEVLKKYGVHLKPEDISKKFAGIPTKKVFKELAPNLDPEQLTREKWAEMYRMIEKNPLQEVEGMVDLVGELDRKGRPISIASASPNRWIRSCIEHKLPPTGKRLSSFFRKRYVSAEYCEKPKPYPDVFLKGKEIALTGYHGKPIEHWFAIGDGESDVVAGLAAGMNVLFLSSDNTDFDTNEKVKRFAISTELIAYIASFSHSN